MSRKSIAVPKHATNGQMVSALKHLESVINDHDRINRLRFKSAREVADIKLTALKDQIAKTEMSSERAVLVSRESQQVVSDKANEFRDSLDDANKNNLPRSEADNRFQSLNEKIDSIEKQAAANALTITKFLPIVDYERGRDEIRQDISSLRDSRSVDQGRDTQGDRSTSTNRWVVGLVIGLIASLPGWLLGLYALSRLVAK